MLLDPQGKAGFKGGILAGAHLATLDPQGKAVQI